MGESKRLHECLAFALANGLALTLSKLFETAVLGLGSALGSAAIFLLRVENRVHLVALTRWARRRDLVLQLAQILLLLLQLLLVLLVREGIEARLHMLRLLLHQPVVLLLDLLDAAHAVARHPVLRALIVHHARPLALSRDTLLEAEALPLGQLLLLGNWLFARKDDPILAAILSLIFRQKHAVFGLVVLEDFAVLASRSQPLSLLQLKHVLVNGADVVLQARQHLVLISVVRAAIVDAHLAEAHGGASLRDN